MKQPAKVSIVGVILAVLAAVFYPDRDGQSGAPSDGGGAVAAGQDGAKPQQGQRPATNTPPSNQPAQPAGTPVSPPSNPPAEQTKPAPKDGKGTDPSAAPNASKPPPTTPTPTQPTATPAKPEPITKQPPASKPATPTPVTQKPPPAQPAPTASKVGFTSRRSWQDHFTKHGHEFGQITADEYLAKAQALRDAPLSKDILEAKRPGDGVICRFDKRNGAFLAYHDDKTIRTYFRPNDGEAYYRRQLTRLPESGR